jgi:hypothetical protein
VSRDRELPRELLDLDGAIAEIATLCHDIRGGFVRVRDELDPLELRQLRSHARHRIALTAADANWWLLDELSCTDLETYQALRSLEPEPGARFHASVSDVWEAANRRPGFSTVSASLHRLDHLGVIEWEPRRGRGASRVRVLR